MYICKHIYIHTLYISRVKVLTQNGHPIVSFFLSVSKSHRTSPMSCFELSDGDTETLIMVSVWKKK